MRPLANIVVLMGAATYIILFTSSVVKAHGIVGDRFFPPTVSTDDPFPADELALPTVSVFQTPGSPQTQVVDIGFEFDQLILPRLSVGISDDLLSLKPDGRRSAVGWNNLTLITKYEVLRNELHEAVVSVGMKVSPGRSGSSNVGVDNFTTFLPTIYYGKGFGDLPDSLAGMKPLAVTGTLGNTFPVSAEASNVLIWGFAFEYSVPYLQQHVNDVGLPEPFKNMIPIVEVAMATVENRAREGQTTGTLNPGVLYETRLFQIGVEAIIPVNGHTGPHVGAVAQVQVYIDDLFPYVFGNPIFFGDDQ